MLHVANIIWCTGFDPGFSWIDLPVFESGHVKHDRGVVAEVPGLFFVGLKGLYSVSSAEVHGVGRDAARVAKQIAASVSTQDLPAPAGAPVIAERVLVVGGGLAGLSVGIALTRRLSGEGRREGRPVGRGRRRHVPAGQRTSGDAGFGYRPRRSRSQLPDQAPGL